MLRQNLVEREFSAAQWRAIAGRDPADVAVVRLPMIDSLIFQLERRRPHESEVVDVLGPNEDDYYSYVHSPAYVLDAPFDCGNDSLYRLRLRFDDDGNYESVHARCEETLWRRGDVLFLEAHPNPGSKNVDRSSSPPNSIDQP